MNPLLMSGLVTQLSSSVLGAASQVRNAKFQNYMTKQNAALREFNAEDALLKGRQNIENVNRKARNVKGSIELEAAAQGQSTESGSVAGNLLDEATALSEKDSAIIRNNAMREAFGYKTQAMNMRRQGDMNEALSWSRAGNTIATGGLRAFDMYNKYGGNFDNKDKDKG